MRKHGIRSRLASWYFSREALPFWAISVLDMILIFMSLLFMYSLVYGPAVAVGNGSLMLYTLAIDMVFYGVAMRIFHTYTDVSRILAFKDLARTACAMLLGSLFCVLFRGAVDALPFTTQVPYRVFVLNFLGATAVLWLWRIVARNISDIVKNHVREEVELLPRQEIEINMGKISEQLHGKRVVVTGAAGSIGSELARQIASYGPAVLILVDQAETPMHDLKLEMTEVYKGLNILFVVSSILQKEKMERIFADNAPDYVFHAAAYKHVPMMEENPGVSVVNNVVGTRLLADLSAKYGVKKFVMVSTDKAVNPTNVMGCSKRLCEIYVQSFNAYLSDLSNGASKTQFVTTRFGNVLGSNGSVIPLFKKQIEAGGPVTVTHPDIIRFFMLIPEACALVLEAGTMGNGGEVFVFDMGKPVKIADLAKKLIQNSGRRDVKIKYTGLRDGEKLYEEVLFKGEEEVPTNHPKIRVAKVRQYRYEDICSQLDELAEIAQKGSDMDVVRKMKQIVPEFMSNNSKYEVIDKELKDAQIGQNDSIRKRVG